MAAVKFNLDQIKAEYTQNQQTQKREWSKWLFALCTFGLGGLYLWLTTRVVNEGEVALRQNFRGEYTILPPGRHSNFPWESYFNWMNTDKKLSDNLIHLGPYKILSVHTGHVAKTYNQGQLEVLEAGQWLIQDAAHIVPEHYSISTRQETLRVNNIIDSTKDNVRLKVNIDIRYQITDSNLAIAKVHDIPSTIKEIAQMAFTQIIKNHPLADFSKSMDNLSDSSKVNHELITEISTNLQNLGITLITAGICGLDIVDTALAHELAQGAVAQSRIQSQKLAIDQECANITKLAEAKATAITTVNAALAQSKEGTQYFIAEMFSKNPNCFYFHSDGQTHIQPLLNLGNSAPSASM